ncbi:MT-A70 family methyltransferase [Streptococcus agalactiae]|jgi:N6-adenosine-specific RNA methylase IME4
MTEKRINITKNPTKYKTILADPPWDIQQKGKSRGAIRHYNLMTLDRIKAMPIADLVEENAHCWLWVTNATLEAGYEVLRAWGFEPRSIYTWCKPRLGLGTYLRNCTEHLLLGTRGKAPIQFKGQMNWGFMPLQDHSHKPEEVYDIIERCSEGNYLELFARRPRHGWGIWGNEVASDVKIKGFPVPVYKENAKYFTETEREDE